MLIDLSSLAFKLPNEKTLLIAVGAIVLVLLVVPRWNVLRRLGSDERRKAMIDLALDAFTGVVGIVFGASLLLFGILEGPAPGLSMAPIYAINALGGFAGLIYAIITLWP